MKHSQLIDDKILIMLGFLNFGERVLRMKREEIIRELRSLSL